MPEASGEDNLTHGFNLLSLAACEASKLVDSRAGAEIQSDVPVLSVGSATAAQVNFSYM